MIRLEHLSKSYAGRPAVDDVSLDIASGGITVLLGPSGCGKSTTLRMINRLIPPDSGRVLIDGRDAAAIPPETLRRGIGYAIQGVGLFPHWNVADNIATVPRLLRWPEARVQARVAELLTLLGLPPDVFAAKRPRELSGGQAQRVGVARALAADPPLLLMDEPFGALDPVTRRDLQHALRRIQRETGKMVVFVTHDMDEALLLADRIVIMQAGRVVQEGSRLDILEHPASDFVRDFVGGDNIGLRRLGLVTVDERMQPGPSDEDAPAIRRDASLRDALEAMLRASVEKLRVTDADGRPSGVLTRDALFR